MDKLVLNIKERILNKEFSYEPPFFYNNDLALRCELGIGEKKKEYLKSEKKRAKEIINILFKNGIDMFFFHDYIEDWDFDMDTTIYLNNYISAAKRKLKFSLNYQKKFKHDIVRDVSFNKDEYEDEIIKINRVCCYPDKKFNVFKIINAQLKNQINSTIHLVSFDNDCILTIYDNRGCDIVFYDKINFLKFYPLLNKYFLKYDLDLMQQRFDKAQ